MDLARQLFESGLLKWGWDPALHPRTGEPPNPGWFAPTDDSAPGAAVWPESPTDDELRPRLVNDETTPEDEPPSKLPTPIQSPRGILGSMREVLRGAARGALQTLRIAVWASSELKGELESYLTLMEAHYQLIQVELRDIQWARTALDAPKTIEELQTKPTENLGGYEGHHIVGQNKYNLAKTPLEVAIEKFGREAIDDRSNIVWIPRLKHELITAFYNEKYPRNPYGLRRWQVVSEWDFESQRKYGLTVLKLFGVLK